MTIMIPTRQFMPRHYMSSIEIDAPRGQVWRVMSDVARWPEWTPTVTRVVTLTPGLFGVGSRVRIHQPGLPPAFWRVTEWIPDRGFTWVSRIPGARVTARHQLTTAGDTCRVTLSIHYEGLFGALLACATHRFNSRYLQLEANGLKNHCEAMAMKGCHAAHQP